MPVSAPSAPHPGLTSARAARATAPRADAESLRRAYLELLKLTLCDLAGASTTSVGRMDRDGTIAARELDGDGLRLRAAGMDWPLHGVTMVGLNRLDDLQSCVEAIVHDGVPGDLIETGTWRGGASILMRAVLDSLGDEDRTVWVADSFLGFPDEPGSAGEWAAMHFLAVTLGEVRANFERLGLDRGVDFIPGFFEDTMPGLAREARTWALVRLDGDTYDATRLTLSALYGRLSVGGYVVVDDYGSIEECRRAVDEFRDRYGIREPLEQPDWTSARWRKEVGVEIEPPEPAAAAPAGATRSVERPQAGSVPTAAEIGLRDELDRLRERLTRAESELAAIKGSPLYRARARLGRGGGR